MILLTQCQSLKAVKTDCNVTVFPIGQKPFPCTHCDALFSTKSNCERHLLRKHGLSSRNTLQNTGSCPKTKSDDGSQGSTGMTATNLKINENIKIILWRYVTGLEFVPSNP